MLGVANINEGSIHQLNYDATSRRKKTSSVVYIGIFWPPVVVGDRGLYSLYVGRSDLRVYYLICVPFIFIICNKKYYQLSVLCNRWYERGGIVWRSSPIMWWVYSSYTTNKQFWWWRWRGWGWHRAWLPVNAISNMKRIRPWSEIWQRGRISGVEAVILLLGGRTTERKLSGALLNDEY